MALVSETIPALWGGISQQSPASRHVTQCDDMVNCLPSIVRGLSKRPPLEHVATITQMDGDAKAHFMHRDANEQYVAIFGDTESLEVYDIQDGTQKTVFINEASYLPDNDAINRVRAITVADYTFVVNRNFTVTSTGTTPYTLTGSYQTIADLNKDVPTPGGQYEIVGDEGNNFDSFYVQGDGSAWREIAKPAITLGLSPNNTPHTLVRNGDGTFTFDVINWDDRLAGDDKTNPMPSFVGRKINDVFFHKDRLGFLSDENIVMSEVGEYFNFFRTTSTDLLDSDPIDASVSHNKTSLLNYAMPFEKQLFLFGEQAQFVVGSRDDFKPKSVGANQTTEYLTRTQVSPASAGNSLFFVSPRGDFASIREYFVQGDSSSNIAVDITSHVPTLVPHNVREMAASSVHDMVFAVTNTDRNVVYAYNYKWQGNEKVQSAWGKWEFPSDMVIVGMACIENYLYIVSNRTVGGSLDRINLQDFATSGSHSYLVHLDRLFSITGTYNAGTNKTTFNLPYDVDLANDLQLVMGSGSGNAGALVDPGLYNRPNTFTLEVTGDYSAGSYWVGEPYEMRYRFSPQYHRDQFGAALQGDLRLRTMTLSFTDTAFFKVRVQPLARAANDLEVVPEFLSEFTGKTVGAATLIVGRPNFETSEMRFTVSSDARTVLIELLNDSHLGCHFERAEWEGNFVSRNRRVA